MFKSRFSIVLLWGLAAFCSLPAQTPYIFRVINVSDGLSDSEVRSINYAPNGLMCIRTSRSLNIYNGATFAQYYYNYEAVPYNENTGVQQDYFDSGNRMWLKETDKLWVFDFNTNEFIYDISALLRPCGIDREIRSLFIDDDKNYWIIDQQNDLCLFDMVRQELIPIDAETRAGEKALPAEIIQDGSLYWILYDNHTLQCWSRESKSFIYRDTGLKEYISGHPFEATAKKMLPTSNGNLWILYSNALYHYDVKQHTIRTFPEIGLYGSDQLTAMAVDGNDDLWLGSSKSGLRIIDGNRFTVDQLPYLSLVTGDRITPNTDITALHIDPNGGVWIATLTEGLLYYHESMNKFHLVNNRMLGSGMMSDQNIKCIVEDRDGTILLGTVKGLLRYDPETGSVRIAYPELANELCIGLYRDRYDRIWLGTFQNGAFCIDQGGIRHYRDESMPQVHMSYYNSTPNLNNVRAFFEDRHGGLWISVYGGIGRFNSQTGEIKLLSERYPQICKHMVVRNIHYLTDSTLLAASDNGMFLYDPVRDEIRTEGPGFPADIPSTRFNCTMQDSRSLLWMGTFDGLFIWDSVSEKTYRIDVAGGLPNNNVYGIEEDDSGTIWFSTFSNLTKVEIGGTTGNHTFALTNFNSNEGVQNGGFFEHSVAKATDGTIYFGGTHGLNIIAPKKIVYNSVTAVPQFIDLKLFNVSVERGQRYNGNLILEKSINQTAQISLNHKQNFIALDFAGLNYVNPAQTYFRYKLEGVDQQWTEINSQNGQGRATYTTLSPGKYIFKVFCANNDKVWGEVPAVMTITITPPFWNTMAAKIFYALLFVLLVYLTITLFLRRGQLKLQRQQERESIRQREELDQMKIRFFTNISHELRTPLTLIITPLNSLMKRIDDTRIREQLNLIRRNAEQLLSLVNQLLDFRKLEIKGETLNLSGSYVVGFVEELFVSFRELAVEKMINYELANHIRENTYIYFDKVKLQKVINNLLSNAFKFTPSGGSITLVISKESDSDRFGERKEWIVLSISDTGIGILEEEQQNIFERFYQVSDPNRKYSGGSGIGLHMIKEYVLLHQGDVKVKSQKGEGSVFTVRIPADLRPEGEELSLDREYPAPKESSALSASDASKSTIRKTLLFVEDSDEFRQYVRQELKPHYRVLEARNGKEGEKIARDQQPDLIISDIMMPVMDGVELCSRLKNDIETSHIPIILLTARQSDEDKMEGYEAGADAYIAKPFNFDILFLRIRKLIDQQDKRKETFSKNIEVNPSNITITSLDEQLLQKALECVEKNIGNSNYSVEDLSADVHMHRMNLYRKLQSVVGQTPSEFIRTIRLKRAAQLLQKSQLPVAEIAEMVGFNTPKYFSRYFREMFGVTPSQYAAKFRQ